MLAEDEYGGLAYAMHASSKARRYVDPNPKDRTTMAKKNVEPQKLFSQGEYDAMMGCLRASPVMDRESLAGVEHRLRERLKEYRNTKSAHHIHPEVVTDIIKSLGQKVPPHA